MDPQAYPRGALFGLKVSALCLSSRLPVANPEPVGNEKSGQAVPDRRGARNARYRDKAAKKMDDFNDEGRK